MKASQTSASEQPKIRIAVVNSHPIQYFAPLYAYLNSSEHLDLTALYCTDFSLRGSEDPGFKRTVKWDVDLLSGYRSKFLGKRAAKRTPSGFWSLVCPELWSEIRSKRYDAVILHGHNYAANLLALLAAKTSGARVMMRCETHLDLRRAELKRAVRRPLLRMFYSLFDSCLAIGSANRTFYLDMGVPEAKISLVPYAVDNDRFTQASSLSDEDRRSVLDQLGARHDLPIVLYASKFQRRKHPDDVLRAASRLRDRGLASTLLMVGSGEMRAELEGLARDLEMTDVVVFPGFINQSELPRIFGASDLFVLPSESEPWGLVVNEAMCAGLPVLVADEVGCVPDLVAHGENGFVFKAGDVDGLVDAMEPLLSDPGLRREMGKRSKERIRHWSYLECLRGLEEALKGTQRL